MILRSFTIGLFAWFTSSICTPISLGEDAGVYQRVLFLGNSITLHAPLESIGWTGNWGMAASSQDKDYVHLLQRRIGQSQDKMPQIYVKNIAAFERGYESYDLDANLHDAIAFNPDLVIIAIGENVASLSDETAQQAYEMAFGRLLDRIADGLPIDRKRILVRGGFWPDAAKDAAMQAAAQSRKCLFVSLGDLGKHPQHVASSEREWKHAGVGGHPGDRGMQAIADAIWTALKPSQKLP